jgi:hypothetical protein
VDNDIGKLIADDMVRRALASDIARELSMNSNLLRPLIKDIVLEVIIHYEAVAKVERCKRIIDLFKQNGFHFWVRPEDDRLCYSSGKLPADLKAIFELHRWELHDYVREKQALSRAANELRIHLNNGHHDNGKDAVQRPTPGPTEEVPRPAAEEAEQIRKSPNRYR